MSKQFAAVAMMALLCIGCAARDPEEQGKRLGTGVGAAAGAGVLAAVGNPCGAVRLLVQGALEASGANAALEDLGRSDPDPKFVAFMEELQRETAERRAARERAREARLAEPGAGGAGCDAPVAGTAQTPSETPAAPEMDRLPSTPAPAAQSLAENGR